MDYIYIYDVKYKLLAGKDMVSQDRKPVEPVPPILDAEAERLAQAQFQEMHPQADETMDVHAAQLKA